jgi:putative hydrolase of the HAD superfamily
VADRESTVAALLLDADGVVQENPPGWLDELRAYVDPVDADAFVADLFAEEQAAMVGERRFRSVIEEVATRWGIGHLAGDLLGHWCRVVPSPDVVALVRRLRASGLPCHLASNQNDHRAAHLRGALGYDELFDATYFSCDVGALKSDPAYFTRVVASLGLPPARLLFVDDKDEFVDVARSCGLRAARWTTAEGTAALGTLLAGHGVDPGGPPLG